MNIKFNYLVASFFAIAMTSTASQAQTTTANEIFSAVDGEYNNLMDDQRVNYSLSGSDMSHDILNSVLSGIDGEYEQTNNAPRVNYSLDTMTSDDQFLNDILSAIDGE